VKDTLEVHQGSVFQLVIAHGYIWSEAADGTRILRKPFLNNKYSFLPPHGFI